MNCETDEDIDVEETSAQPRASSRLSGQERRNEPVAKKKDPEIACLDTEAFERRTKFLREVFLDPKRRHTYEWTSTEKKILSLDEFHNPGLYKEWRPAETEDMASRLFNNLIFNFSHLAMVNVGATVLLCRLINEFVNIAGHYQLMFMIVRKEVGEQDTQDSLRVGFIYRGEHRDDRVFGSRTLIYRGPKKEDFQCLTEGISFNVHAYTSEEFRIYPPCEACRDRKTEMRTRLWLPEVTFKAHVVGLEVTSAIVNSRRNYLAAVKKVDGAVHILDVTRMLQVTLEVVHRWKVIHECYIKRCRDLTTRVEYAEFAAALDIHMRGKVAEQLTPLIPPKHCTGCLLRSEDLRALDAIKQVATEFELPVKPIKCVGVDLATEPYKGVPLRQITEETCLSFVYSSIENLRVVVPVYLAAVGGSKICLWRIGDVNDGGVRQPILEMKFPEGCRPTDVTATLGIAKDYFSLASDKFVNEPVLYATDDTGFLRMWTVTSTECEAALQVDTSALLSVDVNKMYPNMLVIGVETGKIKLYNVWKQCMAVAGPAPDIDFMRMTTIPSYLPTEVYEYLKWYHPVVKVKWINDTLVLAQYAEPLHVAQSPNAATVAIWNLAKDIFDRSDAILCHRSWSHDLSQSWHLAARLVCLYGGHYASLGGVLSSDCRWSNYNGLIAISSDTTGQLHIYRPGVWTWTDYDDAFCLARYTGNEQFHTKILDKVIREQEYLMQPGAGELMPSSELRKNRAKFNSFIEIAAQELETIEVNKVLQNDFGSLPPWAKRTLKLNAEVEKLMKQTQKNLRDREISEHEMCGDRVVR
ncbi:katanin P80 subunit, putative [Babesia caballi]|uniref:Katanin P80 subunit, putative n=1 Tax=Babesia caballi TaxID=5871 RepID=A0AAV4LM44_BABCB|nr:katanin P80 subunit, putative [Babesia caballi]